MVSDETKFCPDCKADRPIAQFTRNKRSPDGLAFYCGPCARRRVIESRRRRLGLPKTKNGQGPKEVPDGHKWCPKCSEIKPLDMFPRNRSAVGGYNCYCKPCHNLAGQRSRAKNGGARNYHLRRRYGITAEHADAMLEQQNGVCAICREAPAVHVDHDHETGKVRGLLCFNCNGALGQFRDRADLMSRAALYLTGGASAVGDFTGFAFAFASADSDPDTRRPDSVSDDELAELFADELSATGVDAGGTDAV